MTTRPLTFFLRKTTFSNKIIPKNSSFQKFKKKYNNCFKLNNLSCYDLKQIPIKIKNFMINTLDSIDDTCTKVYNIQLFKLKNQLICVREDWNKMVDHLSDTVLKLDKYYENKDLSCYYDKICLFFINICVGYIVSNEVRNKIYSIIDIFPKILNCMSEKYRLIEKLDVQHCIYLHNKKFAVSQLEKYRKSCKDSTNSIIEYDKLNTSILTKINNNISKITLEKSIIYRIIDNFMNQILLLSDFEGLSEIELFINDIKLYLYKLL